MGFNPTTDVVLDVLNAADPARASLAAERLQALASGAPASDFALDLDKAAAAAASKAPQLPGLANARQAFAEAALASNPEAKAKVEFEAMTLNSFVGEMLPKDTTALFGQGTAGEIWRSMLSEQISRQIAKSGELGLSRRLFATHEPAMGDRTRNAMRAETAVETSSNVLSAPAAADIANGAILTAARRRT